ncbi:MAG: hypothetical protein NC237_13435 [Eubacterium sp.]|nr:hypothetical protein [Eubacterium sp.]
MSVNKVEIGGETVLDLTNDTVSAETLLSGVTAHDAAGEAVSGSAVIPTKTSQLTNDSGFVTAEMIAYPSNYLLYDDLNEPSIMVRIPKFKISDVIEGGSDELHPAFIVDEKEVDALYIGKYKSIVKNQRAYSLPMCDPNTWYNLQEMINICERKGEGWHLMTRLEWAAIALWCKKNGTLPFGNNSFGKDYREADLPPKAIVSSYDEQGRVQRVLNGSGRETWFHDHTYAGIADLNGTLWEKCSGIKIDRGELQVISANTSIFGNDAASKSVDKINDPTVWKAIDGTTGTLIDPDGNGTTENSLKLSFINKSFIWTTNQITSTTGGYGNETLFKNVTVDEGVCDKAKLLLILLGLVADGDTDIYGDATVQFNTTANDRGVMSGNVPTKKGGNIFNIKGEIAYTGANYFIGFRAAYYE